MRKQISPNVLFGIIVGAMAAIGICVFIYASASPGLEIPYRGRAPEAQDLIVICEAPHWVTKPKLVVALDNVVFPKFNIIEQESCPSPKPPNQITVTGTTLEELKVVNKFAGTPGAFGEAIVYPQSGPVTGGLIRVMSVEDMRAFGISKYSDSKLTSLLIKHEVAHALGWEHAPVGARHLMAPDIELVSDRTTGMATR